MYDHLYKYNVIGNPSRDKIPTATFSGARKNLMTLPAPFFVLNLAVSICIISKEG